MMRKNKQRKLRLVRETLRRLDPASLSQVVGGLDPMDVIGEPNDTGDAGGIDDGGGADTRTRGTR